MWQMVFTHISIEGWIIDHCVQSLFYCSHLVQVLPPNNVEVVDVNIVTTDFYRSSTDTNVTGWIVMRNILESPQGLFVKGSRNI